MALNFVEAALEKAKAAVAQARTQATAQAQDSQRAAASRWKEQEAIIEDALENAGISGVDVQINEQGHAKLVGTVTSAEDRDTAVAIAQQFSLTNLDTQLQVVAAPEEESGPVADTTGPVQYTVKAGESWSGIARRVYGDGALWKALKAKNNNPKMLHPGAVITLPSGEQLREP